MTGTVEATAADISAAAEARLAGLARVLGCTIRARIVDVVYPNLSDTRKVDAIAADVQAEFPGWTVLVAYEHSVAAKQMAAYHDRG